MVSVLILEFILTLRCKLECCIGHSIIVVFTCSSGLTWGVYGSFGGSIVVVKQHGSDEGVERPLGAVDLVVTDMGLFKGRDGNLDEELEILNGVEAKGVDIIDLDDTIEREVQRWSEGSPRRLARVRAE